jgi:hypothetical protein
MSKRTLKIIVDIFMLFAVVLSLIRWDGEPTFHAIAGGACSLLFAVHFILNKKAYMAYTKTIMKLKPPAKLRWLVDTLLLISWSVAIVSGFIALLVYWEFITIIYNVGRLHGMIARIGCILIVIHIFQHSKQIISYFKKKT